MGPSAPCLSLAPQQIQSSISCQFCPPPIAGKTELRTAWERVRKRERGQSCVGWSHAVRFSSNIKVGIFKFTDSIDLHSHTYWACAVGPCSLSTSDSYHRKELFILLSPLLFHFLPTLPCLTLTSVQSLYYLSLDLLLGQSEPCTELLPTTGGQRGPKAVKGLADKSSQWRPRGFERLKMTKYVWMSS